MSLHNTFLGKVNFKQRLEKRRGVVKRKSSGWQRYGGTSEITENHQSSWNVLASNSPEGSLLSFLLGTRLASVKEEKGEKEKVNTSA